jgi:hypothetical protein
VAELAISAFLLKSFPMNSGKFTPL